MTTGTPIDLHGKVALVTGSARRVGRHIALRLAACGMHVVVHYGSPASAPEAESAAAQIAAHGVQAQIVRADLGDPAQIAMLFEQIQARFGRLDLLVNNAAIFPRQTLMAASLAEWHNTLMINLTAPFLCAQSAARLMLAQESGGAIINIADLSAFPQLARLRAARRLKSGASQADRSLCARAGQQSARERHSAWACPAR